MTVKKSFAVAALLMLVCLVMRPQSHADYESPFVRPANELGPDVQEVELLRRIQALEKRIVDLETENGQSQRGLRESRLVLRQQPEPREFRPETSGPQHVTNGTTWRVLMLNHRSSGGRSL